MPVRRTATRRLPSLRRRGFTLVEIAITIAIVVIIGSLTAFAFGSLSSRRSLHDACREIINQIHNTRMRGLAGRLGAGGGGFGGPAPGGTLNASLDGNTTSYQQTGVRIVDNNTLLFFGDINRTRDGNEVAVTTLNLDEEYPNAELTMTAPPVGSEIRFNRNATRDQGSAGAITVVNQANGKALTITISLAGVPRI